jgi:hypothetical protein
MPSKLDPHVATIEDWLAAEPRLGVHSRLTVAIGIVSPLEHNLQSTRNFRVGKPSGRNSG